MLSEAGSSGASVVETAAYVIVRDSSFGALVIIGIVAVSMLVKQLLKLHEKRIADLKSVNAHVELREDKAERLMEKMTDAFGQFKNSLDQLRLILDSMNVTEQQQTNAMHALTDAVRKSSDTIDSVLREHARTAASVAGYRHRNTPPPGISEPPRGGG